MSDPMTLQDLAVLLGGICIGAMGFGLLLLYLDG